MSINKNKDFQIKYEYLAAREETLSSKFALFTKKALVSS